MKPRRSFGAALRRALTGAGLFLAAVLTVTSAGAASSHSEWTWVAGPPTFNQPGVYSSPTLADNHPGGRFVSASWKDASGNFWLFGGLGLDSNTTPPLTEGVLNDLWKWDGTNWTWVSGSSSAYQPGAYGTLGEAAPGNAPGARGQATSWTDHAGNLWLFGGIGCDASATCTSGGTALNDLWKWDGAEWTWMSGSSTGGEASVYTGPNPHPGARYGAFNWVDTAGNLWLFGGATTGAQIYGDLWKWDIVDDSWTWVGGSQTANALGVYGTKGVADPGNHPGGRDIGASWVDASGNFWLFGGAGADSVSVGSQLGDLWKYDVAASQWTWMAGSNTGNADPSYGVWGVPDPSNTPGSRDNLTYWADPAGNFWLFGGRNAGWANDLWKFDGTNWTWVGGSSTPGQTCAYGTQGVPDDANHPGGRQGSSAWVDGSGDPWVFGGEGNTGYQDPCSGPKADLWHFHYIPATIFWAAASGPGKGSITDGTYGFNCAWNGSAKSGVCAHAENDPTSYTLTAKAGPNSSLGGWTGCDSVSADGSQCTVAVSAETTVTAFFTGVPPAPSSPADGAALAASTAKLAWKPLKPVVNYHVRLDNISDPLNPLNVVDTDATTATYTATGLALGTYQWQVRAQLPGGWTGYSMPRTFDITLNKTPARDDTIATHLPKFTWAAVKGAPGYQLEVFGSLADCQARANAIAQKPAIKPTYTFTAPADAPLDLGTYAWHVSADAGATWTPCWSFDISSLKSPAGGSFSANPLPKFIWTPDKLASGGYVLNVDQINPGPTITPIITDLAWPTASYATPPGSPLDYGHYAWRIREAGSPFSADTPEADFYITQMVSPDNGAFITDSTPTFKWKMTRGHTYALYVSAAPQLVQVEVYMDQLTKPSITLAPDQALAPGIHYWQIIDTTSGTAMPPWSITIGP